ERRSQPCIAGPREQRDALGGAVAIYERHDTSARPTGEALRERTPQAEGKAMSSRTSNASNTRCLSVRSAAAISGMTAAALRKALDRRAVQSPDGGIVAEIDGVHGRKLGRLWKVALSVAWSEPVHSAGRNGVSSSRREDPGSDREGGRS